MQESHQEDQASIFKQENSKNCVKKQEILGPHKLGQKTLSASYWSSTTKQTFLHWTQGSITDTLSNIQINKQLLDEISTKPKSE